jgi:hypothetical protein
MITPGEMILAYKILVAALEGKPPFSILWHREKYNIKVDIEEI